MEPNYHPSYSFVEQPLGVSTDAPFLEFAPMAYWGPITVSALISKEVVERV